MFERWKGVFNDMGLNIVNRNKYSIDNRVNKNKIPFANDLI